MKVLYIGRERTDAQAVATALRGIAQNGAVSWTSRLDSAHRWIDQNDDIGALVVGAHVDAAAWRPLLERVRNLPSHPPIVVLRPENGAPHVDPTLADEFLTQSASWCRELPAAFDRAVQHACSRQQLTHAAERQAQLEAAVEVERTARTDLERQLAETRSALEAAEEHRRHASEQLASQQVQYETGMARAAVAWDMVDEQLRDAAARVARSRRDQEAAEANAERLSCRETELCALLADATARRADLEQRLADSERALDDANTRAECDAHDAAGRIAACRRDLEAQIAREIEKRHDIEQTLARVVSDREAADARHASALDDAIARTRQLEDALRVACHDVEIRAVDLERRVAREAELTSMLAAAATRHDDLERRLAGTEAAFEDAAARATREQLAAAARAAERQAELEGDLHQERTARAALEQAIADRDSALRDAQQRLEASFVAADQDRAEAAASIAWLTERETDLSSRLCHVETDRDAIARRLADADAAIQDGARREQDLQIEIEQGRTHRGQLELQLTTAARALAEAEEHAATERAAAADRQADLEARLRDAVDSRDTLQRTLSDVRSAAIESERSLNDDIDALRSRAREDASEFERRLTDERRVYEGRLADVHADNLRLTQERDDLRQSLAAAEERFDGLSRDHSAALAAHGHAIEQLQAQIISANTALEDAERRLDLLQREADRVPELIAQLEAGRSENERRFAQAPVGMFRCTPDGTLIEANHAWSALVRRPHDELLGAECGAVFLESPTDLAWLIGRCVSTGTKESIETTVRRENGARLFVRLSAYACGGNVIECVAEDLTRPRILEDRLARAGRLEAVGRLAGEVALTCGRLLGDIRQGTEQWLMRADGGESRRRGEMILDDLNRAAGYLQHLAAHGEKQTRAPALVDLDTVLHDLIPALKHLAGDDVDVRLLERSPALTVDVDSERVERVLVNLAACGRERMPFGGQLTIEVGTSMVDRQFAARYPNVRPGPHALITVTEARRSAPANELLQLRGAQPAARSTAGRKSTIDLAGLQGLVGACGGHLWMKVQPLGDIVAKIRLPLVVPYGQTHAPALARTAGRGGTIARWFRQ